MSSLEKGSKILLKNHNGMVEGKGFSVLAAHCTPIKKIRILPLVSQGYVHS